MSSNSLVQRLWTYRNVLRDDRPERLIRRAGPRAQLRVSFGGGVSGESIFAQARPYGPVACGGACTIHTFGSMYTP